MIWNLLNILLKLDGERRDKKLIGKINNSKILYEPEIT